MGEYIEIQLKKKENHTKQTFTMCREWMGKNIKAIYYFNAFLHAIWYDP